MLMSEAEMARHLLGLVDAVRAGLPRVTVDALLNHLELKRIDEEPPGGQEGLYVRELQAVFLSPKIRSAERKQFTGFHEGTHALVDRDALLREQLAELCSDDQAERRVIELLCDIGAAEFLMPRESFVPLMRSHSPSVRCIQQLEAEFPGASLPAIAQQIAHYTVPAGLVLVCAHGSIPGAGAPDRARVHIQYSFVRPVTGSARCRPRPRLYQPIRADHPIAAMFEGSAPFSGTTYYPYNTDKRIPCWCEAIWHSPSSRVVAILTDKDQRQPAREQQSLSFE